MGMLFYMHLKKEFYFKAPNLAVDLLYKARYKNPRKIEKSLTLLFNK